MNGLPDVGLSNFWPTILLAIGFPVALVLLNELVNRSQGRDTPMARTLRHLRTLVVPSLALVLFVRYVLELPADRTWSRIVESIFWVLLLYTLLGVINELIFGLARRDTVRERVPKLFRDLVRAVLVAVGGMVIYSQVWGREVSGALTALGVGSVVIGLALQEPLGNIVSGLMLLFERPLNVGDWIIADSVTGRVIEINWRSVHIETPTRELYIVPNVSLYKSAFSNLSRPTDVRTDVLEIGFSYDDAPNRVKEILLDLLRSTPGVLADPGPLVRTVNYADFSVTYRMIFSVSSQAVLGETRDAIMTRLWYVARREGLNIPFPIQMEYGPGETPGPAPRSAREWLREHRQFQAAAPSDEATEPPVLEFARGETVQSAARPFQGFALVLQGHAVLLSPDASGQLVEIGELGPGECFGDQLTAGGSNQDLSIVAREDLKLLVFENQAVTRLLNQSPSLAAEIGDAIESRRKAAQAARIQRAATSLPVHAST